MKKNLQLIFSFPVHWMWYTYSKILYSSSLSVLIKSTSYFAGPLCYLINICVTKGTKSIFDLGLKHQTIHSFRYNTLDFLNTTHSYWNTNPFPLSLSQYLYARQIEGYVHDKKEKQVKLNRPKLSQSFC